MIPLDLVLAIELPVPEAIAARGNVLGVSCSVRSASVSLFHYADSQPVPGARKVSLLGWSRNYFIDDIKAFRCSTTFLSARSRMEELRLLVIPVTSPFSP